MSSLRSGHQGLRSERLHRGDCAKIVFSQKGAPVPERMWVKVGTVRSNGSYSGTLSNEPVFLTNVSCLSRGGDPGSWFRELSVGEFNLLLRKK